MKQSKNEAMSKASPINSLVQEDQSSTAMIVKQIIASAFKEISQKVKLPLDGIKLEHPKLENYGDYSTNLALIMAGRLIRQPADKPMDIAQKLQKKLEQYIITHQSILIKPYSKSSNNDSIIVSDILESVKCELPGFVNLFVAKKWLISQMTGLLETNKTGKSAKDSVFEAKILQGRKIMVEFAHPNTHKAFHIGHVRNISTGESIVRILEASGARVVRANYQGDVGMHIAKAVFALLRIPNIKNQFEAVKTKSIQEKVEFLGQAYAAGSRAYEENEKSQEEIKDFNFLVYASAQRFANEKRIANSSTDYMKLVKKSSGEVEAVYELWRETRQWSLDYFEKIYKRVQSRFDRYYFESECLAGVDIAKEAVKKGILKESDGAIIFEGKPSGLDNRVFVNSLGLPTYEAKELALAQKEFREFGNLDLNVHVVGPEQSSFFQVTFKVEELLDAEKYKDKQFHLIYGWVRLKSGKMSSRLGQVVLGEWLIDEAKKEIRKILKNSGSKYNKEDQDEIAEKAAIAAVKYSFLKVSSQQEIAFDLKESISFEGDSGPYLQYTYARCQSVLRKAKENQEMIQFHNVTKKTKLEHWNIGTLEHLNQEELSLLRSFYRFQEIVTEAARNLSPNLICSYLFDLAQKYNLFYQKHSILGIKNIEHKTYNKEQKKDNKEELSAFRLALTEATSLLLKRGLYLLGIETVERM